jgi:hypothetical protein
MKKSILAAVLGMAVLCGLAAQSQTMYVATKNVSLKTGTGLFAGTVPGITLQYGDQVVVLRESTGWMQVRPAKDPAKTGWVRTNSLSLRRIVSGSNTSASAGELALAGKGFSADVENSYRQSSGAQLNYAEIDRMEAQVVEPQDLFQFLDQGGLNKGE